jgi:hypothetical protein
MQPEDGAVTRPEEEQTRRRGKRPGLLLLLAVGLAGGVLLAIYMGRLPPVAGMGAVGVVLVTLFWLMRAHLPSILLVFVAVLLAGVLTTQRPPKVRVARLEAEEGERLSANWKASGRFNEKLPIVVHLIFDEMMSPGALPEDLPNGPETRQELLGWAEKHSFRAFDSVYSRYYYTSDSIPNMMNREYFGHTGMDSFTQLHYDEKKKTYAVPNNTYFQDMANRGYRTAVFQNTYMNFCANRNVDLCETFDSFDPAGKDVAGLDDPTQRVSLWQTFLRAYEPSYTSELGRKALGRFYGLKTQDVGVTGDEGGRYDVQRFPQWFDRFTRFTASVPRGTHVFAHFLVPHSPYLLLESCVVSGKVNTGYNLSQYPAAEREGRRRDSYALYFAQLRCVGNKLDDFMSAIEQSDNFRDAVIIIHGDHGSRISNSELLEDFSPRDYVDNYGAFFAVRAPNVQPGVDCEFVTLQEVFRRYAARGVPAGPRTAPPLPLVVLSRNAGAKVEAPMPRFGCGASTPADVP